MSARRKRHITSRDIPPVVGEDGKPRCRWCKGALSGRRQSWCSQACVDEYLIRSSGSHARWLVGQRDRGVCAECGLDTARLVRWMRRFQRIYHRSPDYRRRDRARRRYWELAEMAGHTTGPSLTVPYRPPHLWEADHITPVVEGGGACGLDNYRTLCLTCHRKATAALARRRAEERRGQLSLTELSA